MSEVIARPRRSYSRFDTYQTCPEMYYWKYVQKVPEQPSVWTVGGTAFHAVAEQYLRGDLGPQPTDDQLFVAWMEAWGQARDDVVNRDGVNPDMSTWRAANRGKDDAAWWIENGYQMVTRFVRWKQSIGRDLLVFDVDGQPGLELNIETHLGGVPFIAIPDALVVDEHGQLGIMDYKTGKPPQKITQLQTYAAVLAETYDLHATWGLYYMARPGQLLPRLLDQDHSQLIEEIVEFDERERAGFYNAQGSDACRFCPYKKQHCSLYNPENA